MMSSIATVVAAIAVVGNILAFKTYAAALTSYFGVEGASVENFETNQYFQRKYNSAEDASARSAEICEQVEAEGAVLLRNNGALPLDKGSKVSCFSQSSNDFVIGATGGSGEITGTGITLKSALEKAEFEVNPTLADFYKNQNKHRQVGGLKQGTSKDPYVWKINEIPYSNYTQSVKNSYVDYNDAAIVVISRTGAENGDLPQDMSAGDSRNKVGEASILELDRDEKELMENVVKAFDKVIVLLNTTNAMECGFLEDYDIDACLWVGGAGQYGLYAIADILNGTVNPSGRLVDTYAYDVFSSPAMQNMGNFAYVQNGNETGHHYVTYAEGIYVGYKYYETRYEDRILNAANVGNFDYDSVVQYPFGYGLSYTDFEWSGFRYELKKDVIEVQVNIKNTGETSGKEVVQVYFQSPYTDYDRVNGIEKAAVNLAGFGKTKILNPGDSETITVSFPIEYMKSYDAKGKKTYILEEGDYFITAARDAHEATNNILKKKNQNVPGNAEFVQKENSIKERDFSKDTTTGTEITNKFDGCDGEANYLSRNNWKAMDNNGIRYGNNPSGRKDSDGFIYQTEITNELKSILEKTGFDASGAPQEIFKSPIFGAKNGRKLIEMKGKDYSDSEWDSLLDQLRISELERMVKLSGHCTIGLPTVGKPYATDSDGTSAWKSFIGDGINAGGMPNETVQASTWNRDLEEEVGQIMGELALWAKISGKDKTPNLTGWYAPALNIHRTPFGGRNFEYYSEDAILSGLIGSSVVKGATDKGVITYIKHFAFNEQETNRMTDNVTWAKEQALREIYLTPFEMAVKYGGSKGIMTSYNRVGTTWTGGCYNLVTGVLRNEWGFNGFAITDYMDGDYENVDQMLAAGGDAALNLEDNQKVTSSTAQGQTYLRRAAKHLLYAFVNSNGMNGIDGGTYITGGTPIFYRYMILIDVGLGLAFILCVGSIPLKIFLEKKREKERQTPLSEEEKKKRRNRTIGIATISSALGIGLLVALVLTVLGWHPGSGSKPSVSSGSSQTSSVSEPVDIAEKYGECTKKNLINATSTMTFDGAGRGYYYEAEAAELGSPAKVETNAASSGGQHVGYFKPGATMTFTITSTEKIDALVKLSVAKYENQDVPIENVLYAVYGTDSVRLDQYIEFDERTITGTGSWTRFQENIIGEIHLEVGINIIQFSSLEALNYDYMCLISPYDGEGSDVPIEDDPIDLEEKYGQPIQANLTDGTETMVFSTEKRGYYYEAEAAELSSPARIEEDSSKSGGKFVSHFQDGATMTFTIASSEETDALIILSGAIYDKIPLLLENALIVSYGTEKNHLDSTVKFDDRSLIGTGGWTLFQENNIGEIHLKEGVNIIQFVALEAVNYDYMCLVGPYTGPEKDPVDLDQKYGPVSKENLSDATEAMTLNAFDRGSYYEAEAAVLGDPAKVEENSNASGGKNVGYFKPGATMTFTITVSDDTDALILLSGAMNDNKNLLLEKVVEITYGTEETDLNQKVRTYDRTYEGGKGNWTAFKEFKIGEIQLQKGKNIIKFLSKESVNYDYMCLVTPYENSGNDPVDLEEKYGIITKTDLIDGTETMGFDPSIRGFYYEAEAATLGDPARIETNTEASGGKNVGYFKPGATMTFTIASSEETDALIVLSGAIYDNKNPFLENIVDVTYGENENELNDKVATYNRTYMGGTGSWTAFKEFKIGEIRLKKGKNVIRFLSKESVNYDYMCLISPKTK